MPHVPTSSTLEQPHDLVHNVESLQRDLENFRRLYQYAPRISLLLGELDVLRKALEQQDEITALTGRASPQLAVIVDVVRQCSEWLKKQKDAVAGQHAPDSRGGRQVEEIRSLRTRIRTSSLRLKNLNVASVLDFALASSVGMDADRSQLAASVRSLRRTRDSYKQINRAPSAPLFSRKAKELEDECQTHIRRLIKYLGLLEHSATNGNISQLASQSALLCRSSVANLHQPASGAEYDASSKHREVMRRGDARISLDNRERRASGYIMFPRRCCWFEGPLNHPDDDPYGDRSDMLLEQCFTKPVAQRFAWRHLRLHKTLTVAFMKQDRPGFEVISYGDPPRVIPEHSVLQYAFSGNFSFYKTFHDDLRQKYFVEEFETGYIQLNGGEKLKDDYIKLWQDEDGETTVTLPIRYSDGDVRHIELKASLTACKSNGTDVAVLEIPRQRPISGAEIPEETSKSGPSRRNSLFTIPIRRRHDNERQQMIDTLHIEFRVSKNERVHQAVDISVPTKARDRFISLFVSKPQPHQRPSPPPLALPPPATRSESASPQVSETPSGSTTETLSIMTPAGSSTGTRNAPSTSTVPSSPPSLKLPPPSLRLSQPAFDDLNAPTLTSQLPEPAVDPVSDYWRPGAWPSSSRPGAFFRDSTGSRFVYQSLREENEIRLLRVKYVRTGVILCQVEHHILERCPSFEALSYCWGESTERRDIQIEDKAFQISLHLWEGLRRLCLQDESRLLWIDAICINQDDLEEKNHQILLMQHIYRRAQRTLIWLGEVGLQGPTCKRRFRSSEESDDAPPTLCSRPGSSSTLHPNGNLSQKLKEILRPLHLNVERNGHGEFWWKRLWCIQEYHFSALRPSVYIGPHAISWDHFYSLFDQSDSPLLLFNALRTPEDHTLYDLLSRTGSFQCGDPRDRVYSLLGMAEEASTAINPDYRMSALRVYEQACRYLITESRTLDVLVDGRVNRFRWGRDQLEGVMPTWMPDLTSVLSLGAANRLNNYSHGSEPPDFRIDRRQGISTPEDADYDLPQALSFKAVKFDKICARTTEADIPDYERSPQNHLIYNSRQQRGRLLDKILETLDWRFAAQTPHELDSAPCAGFLMLDYLFEDKRSVIDEIERRSEEPERDLATTYRRQRDEDIEHAQHYGADEDAEYARSRWGAKINHAEHGVVYQPDRLRPALAAASATGDSRVETDFHIARDFENIFAYARKTTGRYYFTANKFDAPMRKDVLQKPTVAAVRRLSTQYDVQEVPEFHEYSAKSRKRDFFRTSSGFLGLGPETLLVNDIVVMPFGASRPFILRECEGPGEYYHLIGEAMIPILMSEETWVEQQKNSARYYNII